MRCLIIDDEFPGREVLSKLLSMHCAEITVAGSGASVHQAIQLIHEKRPDLIFLDVEMGDGTGFDVLANFPQHSFHTVFVTCMDNYITQAAKLKAFDYLLKPVLVDELKAVVRRLTAR